MALKFGSEVTENGTIRKLGYGFLFAFHSNYGSIFYHFRDKARYWQKNRIFFILPGGFPSEYCQFATPFGTEKLWCRYQQQHYPVVKKKLYLAVSIEYWRVTNRRMDICNKHRVKTQTLSPAPDRVCQ